MSALQTYRLRATWEFVAIGKLLVFIAPVQVLFAASFAIGLGLLLPDLTGDVAAFLSTGAPTIVLLVTTITAIPQEIARRRDSGAHDFMKTIPGPRTAHLAALLTPHLVVHLPGALIAVVVASRYFDFPLRPTPLVVPALIFVAATGAAIGVAVATLSPNSALTTAIAQIAVFFILLYSPINYPADRLPGWLQGVHEVLPFEGMATLVRDSLMDQRIDTSDLARVAAWAATATVLAALAMSRRQ